MSSRVKEIVRQRMAGIDSEIEELPVRKQLIPGKCRVCKGVEVGMLLAF